MKKIKGYTLLEVIMSIIIFSMLVGTIISIYVNIKEADGSVAGKRAIVSESSDLFDTIHEAAIDFNIDYEEYFNVRGNGNDSFSSYGNDGELYYCSTNTNSHVDKGYNVYRRNLINLGCMQQGNQKYLEYKFQHWKLNNIHDLNDILNSGAYQGNGPVAIGNNQGLSYLYLISNDKTERYYFRRVKDKENNRGVIQALRLVGFDAGSDHDFNSRGAFDGFIDTWACDTAKGFVCKGRQVGGENYYLPKDKDDGWINITSDKINVMDFKVDVFPKKDPTLAKEASSEIIDPYIKISITLGIFGNEENDSLTLSTTLSLKSTYSNFSTIN